MKYVEDVFDLDMNHVQLGVLNETSLMTLFGNCHSRYLTHGLANKPNEILDVKGNILYPAYFMTHLKIPVSAALSSFALWNSVQTGVNVRRYGETILDSEYFIRKNNGQDQDINIDAITMQANSLFVLDPSIYVSQEMQISAPKSGMICEMEKITEVPQAVKESASVRAQGFDGAEQLLYEAVPYFYTLELNRDTDPGHPMMFSKIPALIELSERDFLRQYTHGKVSEAILEGVSLLERKTFYYANAFSGKELSVHTKALVESCNKSLWPDNPRLSYLCTLKFQSEIYDKGMLIAMSEAEKVIVHSISQPNLIQDTKRLLKPRKMDRNINYESTV